ncbi:MAG: hypothetical protein IPJ47_16395 [Anaerolineales bacterium]|nr:hypothetical protein [Anaerolineales bacterium]
MTTGNETRYTSIITPSDRFGATSPAGWGSDRLLGATWPSGSASGRRGSGASRRSAKQWRRDEGGDGGGRTNAGRKAYAAMMQEKRMVGALQAEQNARAAQTQAASSTGKDDYRAGERRMTSHMASTEYRQWKTTCHAGACGESGHR